MESVATKYGYFREPLKIKFYIDLCRKRNESKTLRTLRALRLNLFLQPWRQKSSQSPDRKIRCEAENTGAYAPGSVNFM